MRTRPSLRAVVVGAIALVFTGFAAACVDLFHETSFDTLCSFDASAPGCSGSAIGADGSSGGDAVDTTTGTNDDGGGLPLDICTLGAAAVSVAADHACAWLSTCATPSGGNAPDECLLHARQALDCQVAPNRRARADYLAIWRCLATAASCDAVGACLEPGGSEACPGTSSFVACAQGSSNAAVRIVCSAGSTTPTGLESCATSGQTCGTFTGGNAGAVCGGGGEANGATNTCAGSGCMGTVLHDCDPNGVDRGLDCTNVGAGACVLDQAAGVVGCAVTSEGADAGSCTPSSVVTCDADSGVAHGCPSGVPETVDCAELTGSPSCDPSASGRPWDVARACSAATSCTDSCTNGVIQACVGGTPHAVDCRAQGFTGCAAVATPDGDRYACTR